MSFFCKGMLWREGDECMKEIKERKKWGEECIY
jgi:hypothetical protein